MKRREFIAVLGGAAAWPLAARAQQAPMPVIGFLSTRPPGNETSRLTTAFRRGLAEYGFIAEQNVTIEYRWTEGQYDRFSALAAELAQRPVTVLVTTGGERSALAAKAASSTIPIVFMIGSDPIKAGLVASYNRPDGNATGVNMQTNTLESKRLGLLRDIAPNATKVGIILNRNFPESAGQLDSLLKAARVFGIQVHDLWASNDHEIDAAFEAVAQNHIPALVVAPDPFFNTRREKIVAFAARQGVPTMYQSREYTVAGGLVSYGVDFADAYRQIGAYAGRILKGTKPADLPVVQPTKFELVINMKTAKTLGLTISTAMQLLADEVIE